jgi:hypothetical protein
MRAFCGIDWAEDHHDIAVIDADGTLLRRARIGNDPTGLHRLLQLLGEAGDTPEQPIPVAIETTRGLLVACLRTTRPVYAINPMAVARYRDRYSVARAKSDRGDALVLANILRTDAAAHRPLPADSDRAQPSPSSPEPSKTPSGPASNSPTSYAPRCWRSSPPPSPRSASSTSVWPAAKPAPS